MFYEKEMQNQNKKNRKGFRIEKVLGKKVKKLCFKRKGYDNSFNNGIDKKGIV